LKRRGGTGETQIGRSLMASLGEYQERRADVRKRKAIEPLKRKRKPRSVSLEKDIGRGRRGVTPDERRNRILENEIKPGGEEGRTRGNIVCGKNLNRRTEIREKEEDDKPKKKEGGYFGQKRKLFHRVRKRIRIEEKEKKKGNLFCKKVEGR